MKSQLYDYQQKLVDGAKRPSNGLYVQVGKGKTIMSLTLFEQSPCNKLLIICPNAKIHEWVEDAEYELGLKLTALDKGTAKNLALLNEDSDGYVIMFENVTRIKRELTKQISQDWYVIVDESHSIKNVTSKSTRAVMQLGKKTAHKTILSGTPQSKGWKDYYSQLFFLGALDMSFAKWRDTYCQVFEIDQGGYVRKEIIGYRENITEFSNLLYEYCQFYFPDEVGGSEDIIVELPKHDSYDIMRKQRVYRRIRAGYAGVLHQYLKQMSSGFLKDIWIHTHKLDAFEEVMRKHVDDDIVVFYNLDEEAYGIRSMAGHRPVYEHSGKLKDAKEYMQSKRKEAAIILVQYKSGGTGINWLIKSHVAWFNSLPDRHPPFTQAKGRLDRVGQTKKCLFYIPITKGTMELDNYKTIQAGENFDLKRQNESLKSIDEKGAI